MVAMETTVSVFAQNLHFQTCEKLFFW